MMTSFDILLRKIQSNKSIFLIEQYENQTKYKNLSFLCAQEGLLIELNQNRQIKHNALNKWKNVSEWFITCFLDYINITSLQIIS